MNGENWYDVSKVEGFFSSLTFDWNSVSRFDELFKFIHPYQKKLISTNLQLLFKRILENWQHKLGAAHCNKTTPHSSQHYKPINIRARSSAPGIASRMDTQGRWKKVQDDYRRRRLRHQGPRHGDQRQRGNRILHSRSSDQFFTKVNSHKNFRFDYVNFLYFSDFCTV